jgi:hypothetical protein
VGVVRSCAKRRSASSSGVSGARRRSRSDVTRSPAPTPGRRSRRSWRSQPAVRHTTGRAHPWRARALTPGPATSLACAPAAPPTASLRAGASSRTQDRVARWRRLLRVDLVDVQPSSRGPPTALGGQISPGPPGHQ